MQSEEYKAVLASRKMQVAENMIFSRPENVRYYQSLVDPWDYCSKIPLGFPVKSCAMHLVTRLPVTFSSTNLTIGGNTYAITVPGSDIALWFNPNAFDLNTALLVSYTGASSAFFNTWTSIGAGKGFASNYASYRLVSAGIRFCATTPLLYAQGQIICCETNARAVTDYGIGAPGAASFLSDPDNLIVPIANCITPIDKSCVSFSYTPIDIDALSFISTTGTDPNLQDWAAIIYFSGYNGTGGLTGYLEYVMNYEAIPFGSSEQLVNPSVNPGGKTDDVKEIIDQAKKKKEKEKPFDERARIPDSWVVPGSGRDGNTWVSPGGASIFW